MAARVVVIDHGRIIADDTPRNLKRHHAGDRISIEVAHPSMASEASRILAAAEGAQNITIDGRTISARVHNGPAALPAVISQATDQGLHLVAADAHLPTLDDVLLELTGRSLRDSDAPTPASPVHAPNGQEARP